MARLEGHPEPVVVRRLATRTYERARVQAVTVTLPVAGTPILNNSLYGLWTAEAFLDGAASPCGRKAAFRITE